MRENHQLASGLFTLEKQVLHKYLICPYCVYCNLQHHRCNAAVYCLPDSAELKRKVVRCNVVRVVGQKTGIMKNNFLTY